MPNTYFQFKKFTVQQGKAAMKVCTDACLFGAWVADTIQRENLPVEKVLDIGAGTGLLSLMLAQKTEASIDAVEIDESAAQQAKENFEASVFSKRLQLINGDVRNITIKSSYDLIISNPPFYSNDLKSEDLKRNYALHSEALQLEDLIAVVKNTLSTEGWFAVLLPYHRIDTLNHQLRNHSLFVNDKVLVKQTEKHNYFRVMLRISRFETPVKTSEIIIKQSGSYSEEFIRLLKDYYLYL